MHRLHPGLMALLLGLLPALAANGCGEPTQPAPASPPSDAGLSCDPGTRSCSCNVGNCDEGLVCIAGRCLDTEGEHEPPLTSPRTQTPLPPLPSGGLDAGSPPSSAGSDAAAPSTPADAASSTDAGPATLADASSTG